MATEAFSEYTFEELEINPKLKRAVRELGFEYMTPIQAEAIPELLTGKDVIGQAQTGTGKTAAFGLPILDRIDPGNKKLQAIILCPTRELAVQAANEIRNFAKYMHNVKVLPVYGGQDITRQIKGLKGVQIIVGTPGRVMDHMRRHTIKMNHVTMVVLDEADEMLNMGFREDMEVILGAIEQPHQTCLFSATMPQSILELTDEYQQNPTMIKITQKELTIDRIKQYYYPIKREYKQQALSRLLAFYQYQRCMVFCNTKSMVDQLSADLQAEGYEAEGLHGDLSQKQRDYVMGRFRSGKLNILIATDIAARGIDVDDVEAVFNFDLPQETEYYVHRIGRTGRAGKEGVSHSLCRSKDFRKMHEIERVCNAVMEEKKLPTLEQIKHAGRESMFREVMEVLASGKSGNLIPVIREYCEANMIEMDEFAAACLKMHMGEMKELDDIEMDLPEKKERRRRRDRGDRREHRGFGEKSGHRPFSDKKGQKFYKKDEKKDRWKDNRKDSRKDSKKDNKKDNRKKKQRGLSYMDRVNKRIER